MILVATIEHSGTFRLLGLLGWPKRAICAIEERHADAEILFAHLRDERMAAVLEGAGSMPTLTTYRPPEDIRASWVRRGKDLALLERQIANYERLLALKPYVVKLGRP